MTLLVLLAVGPIFELPVTAMVVLSFPEVAADAVFGSSGTQLVLAVGFVLTLLAVGMSWAEKQVPSGVRRAVGVASWVGAGAVAAVMLGFFIGGEWAVFGVLLAHSAVALGVLGGLAVRSAGTVLQEQGRR